ncbi:hypothetical protein Goshw_020661, partial [Gossypium schwendimanii]|nr:hypothetical protein [Gossypium schwendimanii]
AHDRALEGIIHYLATPLITELRGYLIYNCALRFEWMPYANTDIISCIPPKLLANWRMWDVKVPLIVYVMVEMHESERGKNEKYWKEIHNDYIDAWDRRIEFLPIRETFFLADTTSCLEYILWFRIGRGRMTGSSSAPTEEAPPMSTQHLDQLTPLIPYIFRDTDVPSILHPHIDFDYVSYAEPDVATCTFNDDDIDAIIDLAVNASFDVWVNTDRNHLLSKWRIHDKRLGQHCTRVKRNAMETKVKIKTNMKTMATRVKTNIMMMMAMNRFMSPNNSCV